MRRRISLLVAATTSAVILAFLIPLGLLVRTLAEDRAVAWASQEAQQVATLAAGVSDLRQLTDLVNLVDQKSPRATSVLLPDGTLIEGVVDLAFEEGGAWTVVDYKTDREIAASGEDRYRRQVALYVAAIAQATGQSAHGVLIRV